MTMDRISPVGGLGPKAKTDTSAAPERIVMDCGYELFEQDYRIYRSWGTPTEYVRANLSPDAQAAIARAEPVALAVWYGSMPESNGKANWTATLHRKEADAILDGFCFARSEYPDRVRYEADRMRWIVGELDERPDILDYDAASHSGYTAPLPAHAPQAPGPKTTEAVAAPFRFDARIEWRGHDNAHLVFPASPSGEWVRAADHDILVADLQTLLARVLVMDLGSAEEAAEALGGFPQVIHLVETHHAAHPRPVHPTTSPDPDEVEF